MNRRLLVVAALLGALTQPRSPAADWPQWRGPNRDGISAETGLLKEWPKEGPRLLWQRKDVGDGYSTPAVVGDSPSNPANGSKQRSQRWCSAT